MIQMTNDGLTRTSTDQSITGADYGDTTQGQLTTQGIEDMITKGQQLVANNDYLPSSADNKAYLVKSRPKDSSVQSAYAFMNGAYPKYYNDVSYYPSGDYTFTPELKQPIDDSELLEGYSAPENQDELNVYRLMDTMALNLDKSAISVNGCPSPTFNGKIKQHMVTVEDKYDKVGTFDDLYKWMKEDFNLDQDLTFRTAEPYVNDYLTADRMKVDK